MHSSFKVYRAFASSALALVVVAHQFVGMAPGYRLILIAACVVVGVASALSAIRAAILELKK